MPTGVDTGGVLAAMAINGLPFLLLRVRDINEVSGVKSHRLLAGTNFKKVKDKLIRRPHPRLYSEQAGALVVLVRIDGPMTEYDIGFFQADQVLQML